MPVRPVPTSAYVLVGGLATSHIDRADDCDWFTNRIDVESTDPNARALPNIQTLGGRPTSLLRRGGASAGQRRSHARRLVRAELD